MIPYSAVPYYGPTSNFPSTGDSFNATGAGVGYWNRVFMCNGQNGTPDLRGRVVVGATNTPSTNSFPSQTEPGVNGNPIYDKGSSNLIGKNITTLTLPQIPAHKHTGSTAITTISPTTHSHFTVGINDSSSLLNTTPISSGHSTGGNLGYELVGSSLAATIGKTSDVTLSPIATTTLTMSIEGNNEAHPNVQPGLAFYYIMYIPA
jgi:microcystin-dependent protein